MAVLPFLPSTADSALARLGRDLVITISANLDGVGGIRVADPRRVLAQADGSTDRGTPEEVALGKRLGAGSVVVGDLVRVGPDVRLDLKLLSTSGDSQPLARASITSALDSISALTDSVTWAVLRQVWRRGEPPSPSYANLTTRSVPALRAFLDGERLSEAGRWPEAAEAYAAAIKADSSFWLAGWRYNSAYAWIDGSKDPELELAYESHLEAFGERDRLLIEAYRTDSVSESAFIARFKAIVQRFPADWAAWFSYADQLFHAGPEIGVTNAEVRAALQRTVDLNPKLVAMWEHLRDASTGHDSAQAALAVRSLDSLGRFSEISTEWGFDASLMSRLLLANGGLPTALRDSLVAGVVGSKAPRARGMANVFLHLSGFPVAQVELNRRLLAVVPRVSFAGFTWAAMAYSWAARGAWDSALIALDSSAASGWQRASANEVYRFAVVGALLGGLDMAAAVGRRAAALKQLASMPREDSIPARDARARVAWADGIVALLRRDAGALSAARSAVRQSGADGAAFMDRSLAGLELELRGAKRPAADSLAAIDLAATDAEFSDNRDPFVRSVNHLKAALLLLEQGDTTRAVQLLWWHDADVGALPMKGMFQIFAPLAYHEMARIEEAQGKNDLAIDHYQQFLRRYDMRPPPTATWSTKRTKRCEGWPARVTSPSLNEGCLRLHPNQRSRFSFTKVLSARCG